MQQQKFDSQDAAPLYVIAIFLRIRHSIGYLDQRPEDVAKHAPLKAIAPLPVGSFRRVVALGGAYIAFAEENREEFKILFDPFRPGPRKVRQFPGRLYPILRDCIADAMRSGELRRSDPDLAAFHLWSRVHGVVMLLMACDFSEELGRSAAELTPSALFEATREYVAVGMVAPELWPPQPAPEGAEE